MSVATDAEELEHLAEDLRIAIFRLVRRLRIESSIEDVSDSQLAVIMHLNRVGARSPGQLAEFERVSPPSMNRSVNAIVSAGYARRIDDPDDGRKVIVELTDRGVEVARTARRQRNAWLKAELRPLSKPERAVIAQAVELLGGMTLK